MELYILWRKLTSLTNIWLECDYTFVSGAFNVRTKNLWILRNCWNTCFNYCGKIRFKLFIFFVRGMRV